MKNYIMKKALMQNIVLDEFNNIEVNKDYMTNLDGVFAGGDADHQLVGVKAVAVGKRASVRNRTKFHGNTPPTPYYTEKP